MEMESAKRELNNYSKTLENLKKTKIKTTMELELDFLFVNRLLNRWVDLSIALVR